MCAEISSPYYSFGQIEKRLSQVFVLRQFLELLSEHPLPLLFWKHHLSHTLECFPTHRCSCVPNTCIERAVCILVSSKNSFRNRVLIKFLITRFTGFGKGEYGFTRIVSSFGFDDPEQHVTITTSATSLYLRCLSVSIIIAAVYYDVVSKLFAVSTFRIETCWILVAANWIPLLNSI